MESSPTMHVSIRTAGCAGFFHAGLVDDDGGLPAATFPVLVVEILFPEVVADIEG